MFTTVYLFSVLSGNRYLPRCSKENVLSITITGNVTMSRSSASSNYTIL